LDLVRDINKGLGEDAIDKTTIERVFERSWEALHQKLSTVAPSEAIEPKRTIEDIVREILQIVRSDRETKNSKPSGWAFGESPGSLGRMLGAVSPDDFERWVRQRRAVENADLQGQQDKSALERIKELESFWQDMRPEAEPARQNRRARKKRG